MSATSCPGRSEKSVPGRYVISLPSEVYIHQNHAVHAEVGRGEYGSVGPGEVAYAYKRVWTWLSEVGIEKINMHSDVTVYVIKIDVKR